MRPRSLRCGAGTKQLSLLQATAFGENNRAMMNLLEIMQNAQGGNAYTNLANQFGIGPEQAQQAVEAMLPAFSAGLQQQANTLEGWQNILGSLSQAQGAEQFFDSDGDGIPDHLEAQGNNALSAMFGGQEVSQAVAGQAAQFAGLPASMMQQMLPVVASMIMGGLFKGAMNGGLGGLLGQMMQGGMQQGGLGGILGSVLGQAMAPQQQQMPQGGLGGLLGGLFGGQQVQQPAGGLLGGLLGSLMGGQQAAPPQPQQADPVASGIDVLKSMFNHGQQVQSQQMDAFTQILGQFTKR